LQQQTHAIAMEHFDLSFDLWGVALDATVPGCIFLSDVNAIFLHHDFSSSI
jgi:hypothetical protein